MYCEIGENTLCYDAPNGLLSSSSHSETSDHTILETLFNVGVKLKTISCSSINGALLFTDTLTPLTLDGTAASATLDDALWQVLFSLSQLRYLALTHNVGKLKLTTERAIQLLQLNSIRPLLLFFRGPAERHTEVIFQRAVGRAGAVCSAAHATRRMPGECSIWQHR